MPGPYERSGGYPRSAPPSSGPDNAHPFLTPKGYRLMQNRKRAVNSIPVAFPEFQYQGVPAQGVPSSQIYSGQGVPSSYATIDGQIVEGQIIDGQFIQPGQAIPGQPISGQPIRYDSQGHQIIGPYPGDPFSVQPEYFVEPPLQNVLPSAKFPDPKLLADTPLTPYFETRLVSNPQKNQLRAIGKLVIQVTDDETREPATGSAWIAGPSLIITSAHNLYEFSTGQWSRKIEFLPGFDYYSKKELPTCRITSCCIPRGYFDNPATNHDIAACFVDCNIGDIVGADIPMRPVKSYDFFDENDVTIVGYPAGSGFDFGKQMWQSEGAYLFGRSGGPNDDYSPVMATNFGGGASGCPWLIKDKKTDKYVSVGVTSAHAKLRYDKGEPNLMSLISPYFGPKLFDSLSHNHVFHDFEAAEKPTPRTRKKRSKKG